MSETTQEEVKVDADPVDWAKAFMTTAFERTGQFPPHVRMDVTVSPKTGEALPDGELYCLIIGIPDAPGNGGATAMYLKAIADKYGAKSCTVMMECWAVAAHKRSELPADLGQAPGRREILSLIHEASTGTRVLEAEITRDTDGKPTLGAWQETETKGTTGHYARLLPQHRKN